VSGTREEALIECIRDATAAGVDWIQLREKDLAQRVQLDLTRRALAAAQTATGGTRAAILVNDRLDVALAAGAGGVHLAETSLPVSIVARWKQGAIRAPGGDHLRNFLVGASCHSREGAERAANDGADYIFFGPVFATPSKAAFGPPQGLEKLAEVCRAAKIPVIAIGGITIENAQACIQAGAAGIAAISLFQRAKDLQGLVTELRKSLL